MILPFDGTTESIEQFTRRIQPAIENYRERYGAHYERCKRECSPKMRDPNAVVYLVPGVGMMTFAADKATARIAGSNTATMSRPAAGWM